MMFHRPNSAPPPGLLLLTVVLICANASAQGPKDSADPLRELRRERARLAAKPRRLIMNNDGCDALYFPREQKATAENFLALRTTRFAASQVGAIAYCTISSGFGQFTHNTAVGEVLELSPSDFGIGGPETRNITRDLIDQGTDPLRLVREFTREKGMECFWSMRMNDTHDAPHRPEKPFFLYSKLKQRHPEWLVGDVGKRTPYGVWSSVNYARPEIRELAFRYLDEVCRNYDVDGVELDFFRHLCYFPSVAMGGKASAEECEMMTALMRRIRKMTEQVGLERGRPLLLAIRVPDSADCGRDMGLDFEQWMKEGLIDLLIPSGYFRLRPWADSIALGHRHGVPVYPCLTDSRVRGETRFLRRSIEGYRGRAAGAWAAGADGLETFNLSNPDSPLWHELGEKETLRTTDKLYFVTPVDGGADRWLANGETYRTRPRLSPAYPAFVRADEPYSAEIQLGEEGTGPAQPGLRMKAQLHLDMPNLENPDALVVRFNNTPLTNARVKDGWVDYDLPATALRTGANRVEILLREQPKKQIDEHWSLAYDGSVMPPAPWKSDPGSAATQARVEDGALFIADRGKVSGDFRFFRHAWGADPEGRNVIEARVKVGTGSSYLIFGNGRSGDRLHLSPGKIRLYQHRDISRKLDTTTDFRTYRIEIENDDLQVYVDGELALDARGKFTPIKGYRNEVAFGAANSPETGEAHWKFVKLRNAATSRALRDIVVSVDYEPAPP